MTIVFPISAVSPLEQGENFLRVLRVQVAGRLIGHEEGRVADDRAGDGHALLLAARKLCGKCRSRSVSPTSSSAS